MPPYSVTRHSNIDDMKPVVPTSNVKSNIRYQPYDKSYRTLWGTVLMPLKWLNIIVLSFIHLWSLYELLTFPYTSKLRSFFFAVFLGIMAGFGVTGGAHRYWTHRTFKAKIPLRIIFMVCYAMAGQNKLVNWVQDHRVHHKFSETNADPHNANRGFFFAHVGWLMMRKHPDVIEKGKQVDCSDLYEEPVLVFHDKYFWYLKLILCFGLPTFIPWYFWNESLYYSFVCAGLVRYVFNLNITWSVNSAAHIFGNRPYDKNIQPVENSLVSFMALGEGWHNYHHTFPWDYKAAELGNYSLNLTTMFLDMFAKIGWAYDLKTPSEELIRKTIEKHGDGTHSSHFKS